MPPRINKTQNRGADHSAWVDKMDKKISEILKAEEESEKILETGKKDAEKILDSARKEAVAKTDELEKQLVEKRAVELKKAAEDAKKDKEKILSKARDEAGFIGERYEANRDKTIKHITSSLLKEG
jgi:vacuolar-type H+-ATPase subunit H